MKRGDSIEGFAGEVGQVLELKLQYGKQSVSIVYLDGSKGPGAYVSEYSLSNGVWKLIDDERAVRMGRD